MNEIDFDNKIANNQNKIQECNKSIRELSDQIEDLQLAKRKVSDLNSTMGNAASRFIVKLHNFPMITDSGMKKLPNFFAPILEMAKGSEYNRAKEQLESAILQIENKIKELSNSIQTHQKTISSCKNNITDVKMQKQKFLNEKQEC